MPLLLSSPLSVSPSLCLSVSLAWAPKPQFSKTVPRLARGGINNGLSYKLPSLNHYYYHTNTYCTRTRTGRHGKSIPKTHVNFINPNQLLASHPTFVTTILLVHHPILTFKHVASSHPHSCSISIGNPSFTPSLPKQYPPSAREITGSSVLLPNATLTCLTQAPTLQPCPLRHSSIHHNATPVNTRFCFTGRRLLLHLQSPIPRYSSARKIVLMSCPRDSHPSPYRSSIGDPSHATRLLHWSPAWIVVQYAPKETYAVFSPFSLKSLKSLTQLSSQLFSIFFFFRLHTVSIFTI